MSQDENRKQNINKHFNISVVRKAHCQHLFCYLVAYRRWFFRVCYYQRVTLVRWRTTVLSVTFFQPRFLTLKAAIFIVTRVQTVEEGKKKGRDAEEAETDEVKCGKVRTLWVVSDENKDVSWLLHHNFYSVMEVTFWVLWLFASVITHHSL